MLPKERFPAILSLVVLISVFSSAVLANENIDIARRARLSRVRELYRSVEGPAREPPRTFRTKEGYLRFLTAPPLSHFPGRSVGGSTAKDSADAFLERWRDLFVNESPAIAFEAIEVETSPGRTYVRYQQRYAGLEVLSGQMIVQVSAVRGIESVMSDLMNDTEELDSGEISLEPRIDGPRATEKAIELTTEQYGRLDFEADAPRLVIYCPSISGEIGPPQLVWQTEVSALAGRPVREFVLVNAWNGKIALHHSLIKHALYRRIYDASPGCFTECDLVCSEGDCDSNDPEVIKAYNYMKHVYDFYYTKHGREVLDGNMPVWVYYSECFAQAGSDHVLLSYGWVTDDVVGHEFTHIVLEQEGISKNGVAGAITESFCDIWGEWIDQDSNDGNDADWVKWMVGEDVDFVDCGELCPEGTVALRYMKDPTCTGRNDICTTGADRLSAFDYDYPWDYYNAGIGNKLAYLLTDGDTFREYTITGMGIPKTADLYYECMAHQLIAEPDYYDLGNALMRAAANLEMTQSERENVEKACRAVEIYPESGFVVKDSSGLPVAWFDDIGNLWLKGHLEKNSDFTPPTGHDEFKFKDSNGNLVMVIDMTTGNMYIKGSDSQNQTTLTTSEQSDEFIVKDSSDVVAYINDSGDLYLAGQLYDQE